MTAQVGADPARALAPGAASGDWREWAGGLPTEVLAKVAEALVAQAEAAWAAQLEESYPFLSEERIQAEMAKRQREGNCLFPFARVCKDWRKAQLLVGGPLRSQAHSDVAMPGSVALAKWALEEGCSGKKNEHWSLAHAAASHGHRELVQWLCGDGGFAMDWAVMWKAAKSGNLELVRWLRAEGCPWNSTASASAAGSGHLEVLQWLRTNGCPWDWFTCVRAVDSGHVGVLRWARENGCEWDASTRDWAALKLGYTDALGNLAMESDDEEEGY